MKDLGPARHILGMKISPNDNSFYAYMAFFSFLSAKCPFLLIWHSVTAVKSGRKVIEILESAKSDVDIILFDVELPGEKGFKMLKHVMRRDELNHIAVVGM